MTKLSKILKKDAIVVGQIGKGIYKGIIRGIYTPFLLNTAIKQASDNWNDSNKSSTEIVSENFVQLAVGSLGGVALGMYALEKELGAEYLAGFIVSNVIDYTTNVIKRSKE